MARLEFMSAQSKPAGLGTRQKSQTGNSPGLSAYILSLVGYTTGMQAHGAGITREASHLHSIHRLKFLFLKCFLESLETVCVKNTLTTNGFATSVHV